MSYTAAALSYMFENLSKSVVLTGSQVLTKFHCFFLRDELMIFRFRYSKHVVTDDIHICSDQMFNSFE